MNASNPTSTPSQVPHRGSEMCKSELNNTASSPSTKRMTRPNPNNAHRYKVYTSQTKSTITTPSSIYPSVIVLHRRGRTSGTAFTRHYHPHPSSADPLLKQNIPTTTPSIPKNPSHNSQLTTHKNNTTNAATAKPPKPAGAKFAAAPING